MNILNIKSAVLPRLSASVFVIIFLLALVLSLVPSSAVAQPNCISFESPLAGSVYPTPSCTVSLSVECQNVSKVDLHVRIFPAGSDSAVVQPLGTLSRPPYKIIWNTSELPNQLFTGAAISAEAVIPGAAAPQIARQEGIFLTHNQWKRDVISMPYMPKQQNTKKESNVRKFTLHDPQKSATAEIVWDEKGLTFHVSVKDPSAHARTLNTMADAGLEVMIDPTRRRSPHPTDSTLFFMIPLSGAPYGIDYRAEIADGAFKLVPHSSRINYQHNIGISEFKGYNIRFSVPREAFGKALPDTIACNMVLKLLDENGQLERISLSSANNMYEMYSPFCWSDYRRLPKPLLMNAALQWFIFSAAGFLLAMVIYVSVARMRKPQLLSNFERSEEEKDAFERVNAEIEQVLVKKDLKAEDVASACGMNPQAFAGLIKRNTGFSFVSYLQFCRTEVAKERLRSSRSSEKTIADLCGFASTMEMEKCFIKFHHTTPYKFRTQQQVA